MTSFQIDQPDRIVFAVGAQASAAQELIRLGAQRVLLIAQERHRGGADAIAADLGDRAVGVFTDVRQHVPQELAEAARQAAREAGADWVVAHGGGTAVGFAKAIAMTEPVQVAAVVTTYAGSERTNIWGLTHDGSKKTGRDDKVRPKLVIYDPSLTLGLPRDLSLQSLFNALAHVVAALSDPSIAESVADHASEAASHLVAGIRAIAEDPTGTEGRSEALHGAYLAATLLDRATLGLHHALAHVLGGSLGASHGAAHTALLPYTTHRAILADPAVAGALEAALGADPSAAIYDLAREHGQPHSLKMLELDRDMIPDIADRTLARNYAFKIDRDALIGMLDDAYHARRPSRFSRRRTLVGQGPHAGLQVTERGAPLEQARAVLIAMHGRGAAADRITRDLEAYLPQREGLCVLAPQALHNSWYPKPFTLPPEDNQPDLDSALSMVDAAYQAAVEAVGADHVVLAGFSQGGCLLLGWARSRDAAPAGLLALSASHYRLGDGYDNLAGSVVHVAKSDADKWLPQEVFDQTVEELTAAVPRLSTHVESGTDHRIFDESGAVLRELIEALLG